MAKGFGVSGGVKGAPAVQNHAFALGTRPASLRGIAPPRIKPGPPGATQYGKASAAAPQNPFPQGASFGNTGLTNES
jgi:hypothetical protein